MSPDRINRARGCLLGLAIGDALGSAVEFKPRGSFSPVTGMLGGGPFGLKAGEWTDDTSMALCLGASLLDKGFDLHDQITRYLHWHREGYMSSNGHCFDIGNSTREALQRFEASGIPEAGSSDPQSAGNGCIMRLAPVAIRFADTPEIAASLSADQARTTHAAVECIEASRLFGEILVRALQGESSRARVLITEIGGSYRTLSPRLQGVAIGEYFEFERQWVKGTAYVVDSLEAALWCFYTTDNFRDAVLTAANLGDDADSTAAITGQVAGAFYGESGIPREWLDVVVMAEEIGAMAEQLSLAGEA